MTVENLSEIKKRMTKLESELEDLRYRYYVLDEPTVTDEVYDSLIHELESLEKKYPKLKSKNSPTERVGGEALEKFQKVEHASRMLSLNDVFNKEDVEAWQERIIKLVGD